MNRGGRIRPPDFDYTTKLQSSKQHGTGTHTHTHTKHHGEKTVSSVSGARETGQLHVKE